MNTNGNENHISYILTGDERWGSFKYFNANAYPEYVKGEVYSCGDRYALVIYYEKLLETEIDSDIAAFQKELNKSFINANFSNDIPRIAYYHGVSYIASLHGILYSFKSLLDIMAILWIHLIDAKSNVRGFHKKTISGKEIVGGNIINWLKNTCPETFKNKDELASFIETESDRWILQAVKKYRDTLTHSGEIKDLKHLRAKLQKGKNYYNRQDILLPEMPDGTPVTNYCKMIVTCLREFIEAGTALLPKAQID